MAKTNDLLKMSSASIIHGIVKKYVNDSMVQVLSLTQPWATLLVLGYKKIETRSWYTAHRGELWIHAAAGCSTFGKRYLRELCECWPFRQCLAEAGYKSFDELPRGQILGRGVLAACNPTAMRETKDYHGQPISDQEYSFGDYGRTNTGRWRRAWLFDSMEKLETPIHAKGALQLWPYEIPESAKLIPSWSA